MSRSKYLIKISLLLIVFLPVLFFFYSLVYFGRIHPNVYFAGYNLSNRNRADVDGIILNLIKTYENSKITFVIDEKNFETNPESLGIEFDYQMSTDLILSSGRTGNFKEDFYRIVKAPFSKSYFIPVYSIDYSKLAATLNNIVATFERKPEDSTIFFENDIPSISESKFGITVNRTKLFSDVYQNLDQLSNSPIAVEVVVNNPIIVGDQANLALGKVKDLMKTQIILSFKDASWVIDKQQIIGMLNFYRHGYEDENFLKLDFGKSPLIIRSLNFSYGGDNQLEVRLDEERLDQFLDNVSLKIDRPTIDSSLRFEGGKVKEFTPAVDGQRLDRQLTFDLISHKVSVDNTGIDSADPIILPVSVTPAKILDEEINSLGIHTLLAKGISYFGGSIPNRISNIVLASGKINGTLVAPGEIFSFNKTIGEVSAATGYKKAYVISQGRTVLDDGGGVCQVSTTVFRSVLNAGLPVLARTAHAYRVGYYEQRGFKPGFDATVWAPAVDLQFKNDTDHHILIQFGVDLANAKLTVDLYGTSDERRVEISDPVLSNLSPPLPDKYEDDPTLPKGTVKQVDFSAPGVKSVFKRKAFRGDQLILDDSFTSHYRPWQAIYLVGTGS